MRKIDFARLLPLVKKGQQEAQMTLIEAFEPLIRSLLRWEFIPCNKEDMHSYLVLKLLEKTKKYEGTDAAKFPGYIRKCLVHCAGDYQDAEKYIRKTKEKAAQEPVEEAYTMETAFDWEGHKALHFALKHLYPYERKLLVAYYGENKSMDEIAHEYHISKSKVHYQIKRLLRDLRAALKDQF
ncbi:MAG: sigma-70 family RNA polymerase sigma factor [Acidaminococcus sp.]|jgi:RNA polymerase sigma factor (sigma-70 family)|nr:sigma-70 family RNA polymerase sigma factor [Acidaminococcus sp.]